MGADVDALLHLRRHDDSHCLCNFALHAEVIGVDQKTGDIQEDKRPLDNFLSAGHLTALKFLIIVGLRGDAVATV